MHHKPLTKVLAVVLAVAMLIPGGALLANAACPHSSATWVTVTAPDCVAQTDGEQQQICDECSDVLATESIPWENAHDFDDYVVITPATCTTTGEAEYHCVYCGANEGYTYIIDTIHTRIEKDLQYGYSNSNYYTETTKPTCEDAGSIDYYCSICNDWIMGEEIEPLGHNLVWTIEYEPTADHDGLKVERCTRCGEVLNEESFAQHKHMTSGDYDGYVTLIPATCTTDGERGLICEFCNAVYASEPIEAKGHDNYMLNDYLSSSEDLSSYFGSHNVITEYPTCSDKGSVTFVCDVCGEPIRVYDLEKLGHHNDCLTEYWSTPDAELEDYIGCTNVVTTKPTCTQDGSIEFLCEDCGIVVESFKLDATGHHNEMWKDYMDTVDTVLSDYIGCTNVETVKPTCTDSGTITFLCDECGAVLRSYPLDPLGHDEGVWVIDSDATADHPGFRSLRCTRCDALLDREEFNLHTHVFGEWFTNNDGTHTHICSLCSFSDTAGCKYNATVTDPTCTEGGFTTYVCADCGYTYVDDYTDALGHDWGAWIADEGAETHTRTCNRCGEKETEDHCYCDWYYNHDAKFFKNGTKSMTCDVCGKTVTEKAKFTAWIWHPIYPLLLWIGTLVHKSVYLASLSWFLPWLNIQPKM